MSTINNVRWVAVAQGARVMSQLISMTVLARMLSPAAYGLMAMAAVVTNLAFLFRDFGTAAAIIQKETLSDDAKATIFWLNLMIGIALFVLIAATSPLVANYFREPALIPVLCLLSFAFPLSSSSLVHQALMERASRFRVVALIELSSILGGLVVALAAAWMGAGVYSLVAQMLFVSAAGSIALWVFSDWRPRWVWRNSEMASIIGFSGNVSLFNFVNYFARNADSMVVGRFLGSVQLGLYSIAYRVMLFPIQNMSYVASRALYPVVSRLQNNPPEAGRLYRRSLSFIAFVSAPLMAGLFVLREHFVYVVFGEAWSGASYVLAWLAPVGFIQSMVSTTGAIFMSFGRARLMLVLGIVGAILQVAAFFLGVSYGIEGVAAFYLAANVLNAIPTLWMVKRIVKLDAFELFGGAFISAVCAIAMASCVAIIDMSLKQTVPSVPLRLIIGCCTGVLSYAGLAALFMSEQRGSLKALVTR